jgi:NAD(P)-dependent dehydrogenase (short-subunit alcohol dehydrogenase family)
MQMLDGDVVLVTGAGSGLGLGVARHCMSEGASVAILEMTHEKVERLKVEFGDKALVLQGDVTKASDLQKCREAVLKRFGRLNALIGAQGIFDGMVPLKDVPVERLDGLFDELFHTNVKGYILSARIFGDLLTSSKGAIVLTSSTAAFAADGGGLMYTATKGAVRSMVHQLAFEFAPDVRVNGVAPSGIANSQLRGPRALGLEAHKQSDIPKEAFLSGFTALTLMGAHLPLPEEYGPIYAFLASRHNKIMTGQTVIADQGLFNRAVISASTSR